MATSTISGKRAGADLPDVLQFMQLLWALVHGLEKARSLPDDAAAHGVENDFGSAVEIELFHQARAMRLDRTGTYAQQGGNFLIGLAFGDELQDFPLARRE